MEVGNWWQYKVTDFYSGAIDTLLIKVIDKREINGNKFEYRCKLKQDQKIVDSSIISLSNKEMIYEGLNPDYSYFGDFKLEFPFYEGDTWRGFYDPDTVRVISKTDSFKIAGTTYSPIYYVKRSFYLGGGYKLNQSLMVTPNVGVIRQSIDLFDGANAQKQNFALIDYELK
jgi:hypothetical protein